MQPWKRLIGAGMAATQADIDNLNTAIASGERQVTIGGTSVTYNSIEALIKARDDMRVELKRQAAEVSQAEGAAPPSKQIRLYHAGRGY